MFIFKKKYYLFLENTREFNLYLIKIKNKFKIILKNQKNKEKIKDLINFRNNCKKKGINFYIANNTNLLTKIKADGLYISAYNKDLSLNGYFKKGFKLIGSAHNQKEINIKTKQNCKTIIYSRLFKTNYSYKKGILNLILYLISNIDLFLLRLMHFVN